MRPVPGPQEAERVVEQDFSTFLHTQVRSRELNRLPGGARTVLHGGCAGSWYFQWFDECYPSPVERHIGVEPFSPRPESLPENVEWLPRTLGDLAPVMDGEVDLVYAGQVLEHAWPDDIAAFFTEAHRVLRAGGTLALDSPNRRVTSALGWMHPEHTVEFTADEIAEVLRLAGFANVRVRGMWLSYDADEHRFLPLELLEEEGEWPWPRRIADAEARPEDSFIWWAEGTRDSRPPDEEALRARVQQAYDAYRQVRFADFKNEIGRRERQGDHWIVEADPGHVGYLVYGPNAPMPPGSWLARFRVGLAGGGPGGAPPETVLGSVDVVSSSQATPIASRPFALGEISADGELHELVLPFHLPQTEMGVQFRLHTVGQAGLRVELGVAVEQEQPPGGETGLAFGDVDESPTTPPEAEPADAAIEEGAGRRGFGRSVARTILWPLRRFVDPRVAGLAQAIEVTKDHLSQQIAVQSEATRVTAERAQATENRVHEVRRLVEADLDASTEAAAIVGQRLDELRGFAEATRGIAEGAAVALGRIEGRLTPEAHEELIDGEIDRLDETAARFLNFASSHRGFAAQRNVWFNWPVSVAYEPGDVAVENVNERIAEVTYAFRALAGVDRGAKILDVGASESTVALSLASLGYDVTAIDPRPYPVEHPRLRVVVGTVEDWDPQESFAAVLCISTLEHIGSGEYGQAAAAEGDKAALERLRSLTDPDGLLVLTTPYGDSKQTDGARIYDRATLEALLADWSIEDFTIVRREDDLTWSPAERSTPVAEAVALITARRRD
jgi:2-polyprenyl-3-methyl-5-hydroxy-6-metoxy-1,4-benzoquinol methylase